jgi:hypothetical protein
MTQRHYDNRLRLYFACFTAKIQKAVDQLLMAHGFDVSKV